MISEHQNEEIVIGVHESGIELQEGLNTSLSRNYCASCKKKIHCYVKVDRETHEAKVHITCKSADCECKCRTHYPCKGCGMLHPYGEICLKMEPEHAKNPKADKEINDINAKWRELQAQKQQNMPQIKTL